MTAVDIESLRVSYDRTEVLNGIDVRIAEGEFFFLLGPSGCGKTTLLRTIAGFVEATAGQVRFDGAPMNGVPPAARDCGMVFQNYALWPHLTVFENVAFGLDVRKLQKEEKRRRVMDALKLVRMEEYVERTPNRLSGGQQQRVALARALVIEPGVLLLDEPLSNLDARLRVDLRTEIRDIQRRTSRTAVYVTHDRAEALALADRIAVLKDGLVEQLGSPRDIYERPTTSFVAGFVGDVNTLRGEVASAAGDRIAVRGPYGEFAARRTIEGADAGPSEPVSVLIRPERLRIEAGATARGENTLAGRVVRQTFLGELVQHDVEVEGGAVLSTLALGGAPLHAEDSSVTLQVDDALVFRDGE